jgi:1-acyl-sn-glycerol-3-phosphate acyltransferase
MGGERKAPPYNLAQKISIALLRPVFNLIVHTQVEGLENVPETGPAILMINHVAFLDPVMLIARVPRRIVPMSKIENLRLPGVNLLIRIWGAINVRRGEVDRAALRRAMEALQAGHLLLMAPEGTRSKSGELQEPHDGIAYVATRTGALVIPVGIVGTPDIARNWKQGHRTTVHVTFGRPFYFETAGARVGREALSQMTREAMYQLAAMLPPQQRGRFADLRDATTRLLRLTRGSNLSAKDAV